MSTGIARVLGIAPNRQANTQAKGLAETAADRRAAGSGLTSVQRSSVMLPEVAYIMKGFPRVSEVFISNEVLMLERLGLRLRVFALQSLSEKKVHSRVAEIKAPVRYLPEDPAAADGLFGRWLWVNLSRFAGHHRRLLARRPMAYLKVLLTAVQFSMKYRSRFWSVKKSFFKDFLRAGYIAAEVQEAGTIGHLHGHFCHGSTTITMWVSRLTGIPFSFTAHAKDIYLPSLNPKDLLPKKIRAAEFVATCTAANRAHLQSLCPDVDSVHTIYHGLATDFFTPADDRQAANPPMILAVGRFVKKKGFPYLIEACRMLHQCGLEFRCQLVGAADEDSANVRLLIERYGLQDHVEIRGAVSQEQLRDIYRQCTVFALPCMIVNNGDRDGIPNVLVEAMATGKPVITTAVSGIPELVAHGIDGLVVPPEDAAAFAEGLATLLQNPALRFRFGNNARAKVCQCFDSEKTTIALKDLFTASLTGDIQQEITPCR